MSTRRLILLILILFSGPSRAADVTIDCSKPAGTIRALHGVNNGPLDGGGLIDLTKFHRELRIPFTRLHDAHWPNPDVVDLHAVFPDWKADPGDPKSYDFLRTDQYISATLKTGSKVIYRLGESIEHGPDKRRLAPPDPRKFAAVCLNIIRHYNEGWADGHRHDIRYWEIWNEPDNRPNMWTGSDEDYFRLYSTAAKEIKRHFPHLKVGGPAVGNTGDMKDGNKLHPPPFLTKFVDHCKRDRAPLDFFSWHLYSNDPRAFARRARAVRGLLDQKGFDETESHLNEWNYLPDNDWTPVLLQGQGEKRERFYDRIGNAEGAAFTASALIALQDAPLDVATYYAGDTNPFGPFTRHGAPRKTFHALKAFALLLDTPARLSTSPAEQPGIAILAGTNSTRDAFTILLANFNSPDPQVNLRLRGIPWSAGSRARTFLLDPTRDLEPVKAEEFPRGPLHLRVRLAGPSVRLIMIRSADSTGHE
jgi:hypothetical protein